jgi:hypothetical protein
MSSPETSPSRRTLRSAAIAGAASPAEGLAAVQEDQRFTSLLADVHTLLGPQHALRLLKIIEPYLVEQNRMANAQLLGYKSKHLGQNFFFIE